MFPMVVKSALIFEAHHHDICVDKQTDSHLHTKDIHCELYKFTAVTHFITIENIDDIQTREFITQSIYYNYNFLHNHRPLSFSLRGPPHIV